MIVLQTEMFDVSSSLIQFAKDAKMLLDRELLNK